MVRTQISLTQVERRLLDLESRRTGKSMSALVREAVARAYGDGADPGSVEEVLNRAAGAWRGRDFDGEACVDRLRAGARLDDAMR
ncbi:MAG: ribbon-helix-helix protein, CopG family [Bifidobacteriaceae bacterium]|nr:ribbon-helix-helix protein, CopG family [Bifidobacteriaceae bacterium]